MPAGSEDAKLGGGYLFAVSKSIAQNSSGGGAERGLGVMYPSRCHAPVACRRLLVNGRPPRESEVGPVRATLGRCLGDAWRDELIPENPVAKVKAPQIREVKRERAILTDAEVLTLANDRAFEQCKGFRSARVFGNNARR